MAMTGLVIPEIANVSGLLPSTVDRMLRVLRGAGMVAMGKPGRGREHGHYSPSDLANVILGMAGPQPSDAVEAVLRLRTLTDSEGNYLGSTLERQIEEVAAEPEGDQLGKLQESLPFALSLCFDAPHASMSWLPSAEDTRRIIFIPQRSEYRRGSVTRTTNVHQPVIMVAGRLWLDTQRQRSGDPSPAPPGQLSLPDDAGTTNENGAPGRAPRTRLQDRGLAIPAGHAPVYKRKSENAQALLSRGPGLSPKRNRKDPHHGRATYSAA